MKVLFAVNNDKIAESIIRKYQEEYKEIISSKTVYYFNAIIKELQKDKSYDRIVISEDLEMFSNDNYQAIDKFVFEKLDAISDEATNNDGNDVPIIFLCTDRRTKNDPLLIKLFGIGVYGVLVGQDRSIQKVCSLLYKPRSKKEAKQYYKVESENVNYVAEDNSTGVSESEIQNIVYHYKKIGNNVPKCVKSFDSIYAQYSEDQVKLIVNVLPTSSRIILEENSETYRNLMGIKGKRSAASVKKDENEYVEKTIESGERLSRPVIIPTQVNTKKVVKIAEAEAENKKKAQLAEARKRKMEQLAQEKAEAESKRKAEEAARKKAETEAKKKAEEEARKKAEAEAKKKAEEAARKKAEAEAKRKAEEVARKKAEAEAEAKRKAAEEAKKKAEAKKKEEERKAKEKAMAEAKKAKQTKTVETETTETTETTAKRGRGRPRKNPVEEVAETVIAVAPVAAKRGRGRPRKNPVEVVEEEVKTEAIKVEPPKKKTSSKKVNKEKAEKVEEDIDDILIDFDDFDDDSKITDIAEENNKQQDTVDDDFDFDDFDDEDFNEEDLYDDEDIEVPDFDDEEDDEIDEDEDLELEDENEDSDNLDVAEDDDIDLDDFDEDEEDIQEDEEDNIDSEDIDESEDDEIDLSDLDEETDEIPDFDDEEDDEIPDFDEDDDFDFDDLDDDFDEMSEEDDNEEESNEFDEEDEEKIEEIADEEDDFDLEDLDDELEDEDLDFSDSDTVDSDTTEQEDEDEDFDLLDFDDEDEDVVEDEKEVNLEDNEESLPDFDDSDEDEDLDLLDFDDEDEEDEDKSEEDVEELNDEEDLVKEDTNNEEIKENEDEVDLLDFDDDDEEEDNGIEEEIKENEENDEDIIDTKHNGNFAGINNKNYKYDDNLANSIKDLQETEQETPSYNADVDSLITSNSKTVAFVGTSKNGTSFTVNNIADILSGRGIKTAILDLTKNKNAFYTYTNNEETLRETAYACLEKLRNGVAEGINVNNNLSVFTCLPGEDDVLDDATSIIQTLIDNFSVVLMDCDFDTRDKYFKAAQEIYLVQSLDVLTIQPLTAFLRDLKVKGILNPNKLRIVINKNIKVSSITEKMLIDGMSSYNDPGMTYMTELFNSDNIKYATIPFDGQVYIKYLEGLVNCKISTKKYPKYFINTLNKVADMVYPMLNGKKDKNFNNYSKKNKKFENAFSDDTNSTLDKMKNNI